MTKSFFIFIICIMFLGIFYAEAQVKIIRRGGDGKTVRMSEDFADLPELGSIILLKDGKLVVDMVSEKNMRPKEYASVDIQEGDVIMMVNGKRVKSPKELKEQYSATATGSQVKLGIQRKEEMMIIAFDKADPEKLPKRKIMINGGDGDGPDDVMVIPNTGLFIGAKGKSVFIDKILTDIPSSSLKDADVKEGDAITGINGTKVGTFREFSGAYKKIAVGEKITITSSRKGKELSFSFTKSPEEGERRIIRREKH